MRKKKSEPSFKIRYTYATESNYVVWMITIGSIYYSFYLGDYEDQEGNRGRNLIRFWRNLYFKWVGNLPEGWIRQDNESVKQFDKKNLTSEDMSKIAKLVSDLKEACRFYFVSLRHI